MSRVRTAIADQLRQGLKIGRSRLLLLLAVVLVAALATSGLGLLHTLGHSGVAQVAFEPPASPSGPFLAPTPTPFTTPTRFPTPSPTPTGPITYEMYGPGTYEFAPGDSAVFGTAGPLRHYRVAVEDGIPISPEEFAGFVDATLGDSRSWIAGENVRLQRLGGKGSSYFTIYLVTPGTARRICLAAGFDIGWRDGEPFTSCYTGRVMINVARYVKGISNYGAPLEIYRQYLINHEVGHGLGHRHELCPASGRLAPVMQQQTLGMQGCTANGWPYLDGERYTGPRA